MTSIISCILLIINIVTFAITVLFAIFGVYEYFGGPDKAEKMLEKMHFPLNYRQTLIIGFVSLVIMGISYILRKNLL